MGWESDREPLDYLQRRLRYYTRKERKFKRLLKEPMTKYQAAIFGSKKSFSMAIQRTIEKARIRISQFTEAIEKLKKP